MKEKTATNLSDISIPEKEWFSTSKGIEVRKNEIDPLLISLHKIKKEINILEKNLLKQIEIKKQKHNYKQIWQGFDKLNDNKSYVTTMTDKQRWCITWVKNRQKNIKILRNKFNKINKMLEVYLNQTK